MSRRHRLAVLVSVVWAATVLAQQEPRFTFEREVATQGSGPRRLAVDVPLLSAGAPFAVAARGERVTAEGGLDDLRLYDSEGRPVPYLLVQRRDDPTWRTGRVLPIATTKTTSGFEVDLDAAAPIDRMRVAGIPGPFLKRLTLEGSGDRARWTMLQAEGTLFDLPEERIAKAELSFTAGAYRYLRVTWNDATSGRVPLPTTVLARQASPLTTASEATADVVFERRPSEPGRSRYRLRLPASQLPVVALDLDVANAYVHRQASVSESRFTGADASPASLGSAALVRMLQSGTTAESLRISITAPTEPELDLTVEDADNPPLEIRRISVVFAELPWIYFVATSPKIVARYGDRSATAPSYDLEAARPSIDLATTPEARWLAPRPVSGSASSPGPGASPAAEGARLEGEFRFSRALVIPKEAGGLMALPLDAAALSHSRGVAGRFADIRIVDASERQVPYLLERRDEPLSLPITAHREPSAAPPLPANPTGTSVYRLPLPEAHLPDGSLAIETTARVFQRTVQLGTIRPADRSRRDAWFEVLSSTVWRHAEEQTAAPALTLAVPTVPEKDLWLVIDEGDNAPLPIASARLLLPSYRLRFFAPAGAPLRMVYGRDDLQPPRYDLSLLAARVMGAAATEVGAAPESAPREETPFISPRWFWVLLAASVVVLLGLIVRLVRRA